MVVKSPIETLLAEVSTFPPSPPRLPALALILPLILVTLKGLLKSAMIEIVPPLPLLVGAAFTLILPLWVIELLASRIIRPPLWVIPSAWMLPELMTLPVS